MTPIVPDTATRLFSVGHSNLPVADFLALLRERGVTGLVDVRRFPQSRRNPQFAADFLKAALEKKGILYRHLPGLGGYRQPERPGSHPALEEPAFRGYAEHMEGPAFEVSLGRLESWAMERPVAILCAEAHPGQCHRNLLSDALVRDGFSVVHILGPGRCAMHRLSPLVRIEGRRLIYDAGVFTF